MFQLIRQDYMHRLMCLPESRCLHQRARVAVLHSLIVIGKHTSVSVQAVPVHYAFISAWQTMLACQSYISVCTYNTREATIRQCVCAGNTSAIADYMFGSVYLAWPSPAAAAYNVSATVSSLKLSPKDQTEAFVQSIRQTLSRAQPVSTGVLIAAALGANETNAITEGFELVRTHVMLTNHIAVMNKQL